MLLRLIIEIRQGKYPCLEISQVIEIQQKDEDRKMYKKNFCGRGLYIE